MIDRTPNEQISDAMTKEIQTAREARMKMSWTVFIYKKDARTKTGERAFSTTIWMDRDRECMEREVSELLHLYPKSHFRIEYFPQFKTVKNLMSGKDVIIATDTPRCLDPSSEAYWSI